MENYQIWTDFGASYEMQEEQCADGVKMVRFAFSYPAEEAAHDRVIGIDFSFPIVDITGWWAPSLGLGRNLWADWGRAKSSVTASSAPILCLYNADSQNKVTLSWSEINQLVEMQYGVHEEDGTMICQTKIHLTKGTFAEGYQVALREDHSDRPYWEAIRSTMDWWEQEKNLTYLVAPKAAREPLYSFWYSFHQNVDEKGVEEECRRAKDMGFSAVIVDDGWQTADNNRGYAFCGDWEMEPSKFPDFAAHVKRVQDMGLKYMLWFSVPFIGIYAKAFERFKDKMLYMDNGDKWGVLDLRYPEAREYLLGIYEKAVFEWNLDGLKLDFIDNYRMRPESPAWREGMDYADIQEALIALLSEINTRFRAKKPDLLIEFRQSYVGPQVQCYGNMLRVGDCPESGLSNRVGIADLRMLSKTVAIHSDMLMWHPQEKAEDAALQVQDCLFGVLQFSVNLDRMTDETKKMVQYWMGFMQEHMDLLQNTMICPREPENLYPEISVCDGKESVLAHYSKGRVVNLTADWNKLYYVHAVKADDVVIRNCDGAKYAYEVVDCMGQTCGAGQLDGSALTQLAVPTAGMVTFERIAG